MTRSGCTISVTLKPPSDLFVILSDRFTSPANIVTRLRQLNRAHADLCSILDRVNDVYQVRRQILKLSNTTN